MKIILVSIGTRGDMEPFLAIGEMLKAQGHEILCCFPDQFRPLAEDSGFGFSGVGYEFIDMLESPDGKAAMGGGGSWYRKLIAYIKLATKYKHINKAIINKQYKLIEAEKPDRVIHNAKAIYPLIWSTRSENKNKAVVVSPVPYIMHEVKDHSHVAFNGNYGRFINRISYTIASWGLISTVASTSKKLPLETRISRRQIQASLNTNKFIYTISPSIFKKPSYWPQNVKVLGYHERDKTSHWEPSQELKDFLQIFPNPIMVTFGSMTNPAPEIKTELVIKTLIKHKIAAIINSAAGGLIKPPDFSSDHIVFVNSIPYDWILPKISYLVHHGGSGTTHMALKYQCASLIIPHIIDQFVWNKIISNIGAGPKGVRIDKLNSKNFERLILELMGNAKYLEKAMQLGRAMQEEQFVDKLSAFILNEEIC